MAVAIAALLAWPTVALAHAQAVRADPPMGGEVTAAPAVLQVWFSEEVDPKEVALVVTGPAGDRVDRGDAAVDLYDPQRVHVTASLAPGLGPGLYVVQWHTRSAIDGDAADGSFSFAVTGTGSPVASAAAPPPAAPTPSAVLGPTPTPPASSGGGSGVGTVAVVAAVIVAIAVVAGLWF
ncbi:MAG TPA: copper resistance CopC family protein, partial [Gemmataceae bacterium]